MASTRYQPATFETKWQEQWAKDQTYKTPPHTKDKQKKKYVLDMFPYPSGAGLHVGHVEGYTATDIYARYCRMKGYQVLHPMGFDSFGLPAENYAIKTGKHPQITTDAAIEMFTSQMKAAGFSYDWDLTLAAHWPSYYKWTQWLFLFLYKRGLAYRKKQNVNWCPGCHTVLANEQVVDGLCERCDSMVIQKDMEQWFFKITNYSERLLQDLDKIDWPQSTKLGQVNWIGKSEGAHITWKICDQSGTETGDTFTVFTTRADTVPGANFIVMAPESPLVATVTVSDQAQQVAEYQEQTKSKKDLERQMDKKKTGVFCGRYAKNPFNGAIVPIYVADYVLGNYGTGVVMGMSGHDERDRAFALAFDIPTIFTTQVPKGYDDTSSLKVWSGVGVQINSGNGYDGLDQPEASKRILRKLENDGTGKTHTQYKLRDWLISRQRFWGAPIPMKKSQKSKVKSQNGGHSERDLGSLEFEYTPVPESELPVVLPMDVKFDITGRSPLTEHPDFADREVDTMDTFVDSSWYFFRFAMLASEKVRKAVANGTESNPFEDKIVMELMKAWSPVDLYVGGAEHTVLHLLYSRFLTKVLFDAGYIDFDEPFLKLRHQGIIMGPDHRKMSKRWGNVINPLDVIAQYGADTLRMYEMFMGPLDQMKAWQVESVSGVYRFLCRVWSLSETVLDTKSSETHKDILVSLHKTIKKVDSDVTELKFNTAIAMMMEHINIWEKVGAAHCSPGDLKKFLILLAPFAPFITEELWSMLGAQKSIHLEWYPEYDPALLVADVIEIPVQVNGKVRDTLLVPAAEAQDQSEVVARALASEKVQKFLPGTPKKVIFVAGRIVNLIG